MSTKWDAKNFYREQFWIMVGGDPSNLIKKKCYDALNAHALMLASLTHPKKTEMMDK